MIGIRWQIEIAEQIAEFMRQNGQQIHSRLGIFRYVGPPSVTSRVGVDPDCLCRQRCQAKIVAGQVGKFDLDPIEDARSQRINLNPLVSCCDQHGRDLLECQVGDLFRLPNFRRPQRRKD